MLSVASLNKPTYTVCPHQCTTGCAIYGQHPQTCRDYICTWREGVIAGEQYRPDQLGVIFDVDILTGARTLNLYEVWAGAFEQHRTKIEQIKNELKARFAFGRVVWVPYGLLAPPAAQEKRALLPVGEREYRYTRVAAPPPDAP